MANGPSTAAGVYDQKVTESIPFYATIHEQVMDLVAHSGIAPKRWLDAGGGTGRLVEQCLARFPGAEFTISDPMEEMRAIAIRRFADAGGRVAVVEGSTEELDLGRDAFDVITAVLSNHYLSEEKRRTAVANCHAMLRPGGMFVAIEHVAALTERGKQTALDRWRGFQVAAGKPPAAAAKHIARYGVEYFPITLEKHLALLRSAGFATVEVFWYAYSDIGVYGIK